MSGVTRADICVIACAEAWRGDGEIVASPIGTIPMLAVRLAASTFEPDLVYSDGDALALAEPIAVNARVIAATNQNLSKMVKEKKFREDLFYRLNVVPLEIPPLQFRRIEDRSAGGVGLARGRAIGILERGLVLTLILFGDYASVGFLMAAKALLRFKSIEDPERAEYLLIGTLASLSLAVLGAVGIRLLLV